MTYDPQPTAQIIAFPSGARKAALTCREQPKPVADVMAPRQTATAFGGAWYHDAAIEDAKRAGER